MTYTIVLVLIIILGLITKTLRKKQRAPFFLISCFFLLGLLSGFRYENDFSDFQVNYFRVIQAYSMNWDGIINYSIEFIHQIYRKVIAVVFKDPQWYFIFSSLFTVGMHMICAKNHTSDLFLFVLLYYTMFSYFTANVVTRQGIAVGVTLLAWDYLIEKKPVKFSLVMLIAVLIHTSAVFFIPLYFISFKKFSRNMMLGYFLIGGIIVIFSGPIISLFQRFVYSDYVEGSYGMAGSNPLRLVLAFIAVFAMLLYVYRADGKSYITESEAIENIRYKNFILHGSFMFVMCYILSALRMLLFTRLAMYFGPCVILCIIHGIESEKGTRDYIFFRMGIILFAVLWFAAMNYSGKLNPTPYTPFWEFPSRMKIIEW